jgi:hypothetical protein
MRARARSLADRAEEQAKERNLDFAIWLMENAIELSDASSVSKLCPTVIAISNEQIAQIIKNRAKILNRLEALIEKHAAIQPEEWMLIVSDLSGCYAVNRFASRFGHNVPLIQLDKIMKKLSVATDQFQSPPFQEQLNKARSRFPNPLPPPI